MHVHARPCAALQRVLKPSIKRAPLRTDRSARGQQRVVVECALRALSLFDFTVFARANRERFLFYKRIERGLRGLALALE